MLNFRSVTSLSIWIIIYSANGILRAKAGPTHSDVTFILQKMLKDYDSRLRPEFGGKCDVNKFRSIPLKLF